MLTNSRMCTEPGGNQPQVQLDTGFLKELHSGLEWGRCALTPVWKFPEILEGWTGLRGTGLFLGQWLNYNF
jgi:hypothetical protein